MLAIFLFSIDRLARKISSYRSRYGEIVTLTFHVVSAKIPRNCPKAVPQILVSPILKKNRESCQCDQLDIDSTDISYIPCRIYNTSPIFNQHIKTMENV